MTEIVSSALSLLNLLLIPIAYRMLEGERRMATLEAQMNILLAHSGVRADVRK